MPPAYKVVFQYDTERKDPTISYVNGNKLSCKRLLTNVLVRARVDWLKRQNAMTKALSRERKREILASIAEDKKLDARARISAIQEDNRMTGDSADNVNIGSDGITINLGRFLDD